MPMSGGPERGDPAAGVRGRSARRTTARSRSIEPARCSRREPGLSSTRRHRSLAARRERSLGHHRPIPANLWMDHRIGTCSACGARYRIPSNFAPNQARCRACSGVVHIAPSQAPASGALSMRAAERASGKPNRDRGEPAARRGAPSPTDSRARSDERAASREPVRSLARAPDAQAVEPDPPATALAASARDPSDRGADTSEPSTSAARAVATIADDVSVSGDAAEGSTLAARGAPGREHVRTARHARRRPWLVAGVIGILLISLCVWLVTRGERTTTAQAAPPSGAAPRAPSGAAASSADPPASGELDSAGH